MKFVSHHKHILNFIFLLLGILAPLFASNSNLDPANKQGQINQPPFLDVQAKWVDITLNTMTLEEKIGQLFMIAAYSNKGKKHINDIASLIRQYHIGGVIFFQGGPVRQARYTNYLQSISKVPLLVAMDAEWGLSMRLDSTMSFPRQLTLGAIQDNQLIYEMGNEIARQCKRLGVHINLAPVIDINNNPLNPVINDRSFGENKYNVTNKGIAYMKGLQDGGILACAKHFPGHGDTDIDSHKELPVITHDKKRLHAEELYPFKKLINTGVGAIMSAHLYIPAYESKKNLASSLSKIIVHDLLKKELAFKGIVFTDALNMKGVTNYFPAGNIEVQALSAGNDILLFPQNVSKAMNAIKEAINEGNISEDTIDEKVKKILKLKYWLGLSQYKPIEIKNLYKDLNTPRADLLKRKLIEASLTLVKNKDKLIPLKKIEKQAFASLSINSNKQTKFQSILAKYVPIKHHFINKKATAENYNNLLQKLERYSTVIVGLHNMSRYASKNYGIPLQMLNFLEELNKKTRVILTVFGSPYSLKYFKKNFEWILLAYENNTITQSLSAQLLFGAIEAKGKLPVTASRKLKYNEGLKTHAPIRLKYTTPEEVDIRLSDLYEIDSIVLEAINGEMTPGCQILIAKDAKVIYEKSFGFHTYQNAMPVKNSNLYDLASITKIIAVMPALMRLYDQNILDVNKQLGDYLKELDSIDKKDLIIKDILTHRSGLKSWIPFYIHALRDTNNVYFSCEPNDTFDIRVAERLYMRQDYIDTMWHTIYSSKLKPRGEYLYSDLGFYFFKEIIEQCTDYPLELYVRDNFYAPLGLSALGYNPLERFPLENIVPTQMDTFFRKELVHGYVHDPGAAMTGGVGGHAGLFSNANDLSIFMQMLLNKGKYGGKRFFKKGTIDFFTDRHFEDNRRGLGFDKPEMDSDKINPASDKASHRTFGHTGFTGTCVWADPEYNLIFIFLSNRIYPDIGNTALIDNDIRTRIQDVVYNAIIGEGQKDSLSLNLLTE